MSDAGSTFTNCQGDDAQKDFEMAIEDGPQQNSKKYVFFSGTAVKKHPF